MWFSDFCGIGVDEEGTIGGTTFILLEIWVFMFEYVGLVSFLGSQRQRFIGARNMNPLLGLLNPYNHVVVNLRSLWLFFFSALPYVLFFQRRWNVENVWLLPYSKYFSCCRFRLIGPYPCCWWPTKSWWTNDSASWMCTLSSGVW